MAKEFIKDAAHALLMAFRFTQSAHRTNDLPTVLIPEAAWAEFVREAWRESGPLESLHLPGDGSYVIFSGVRFRPGSVADAVPATPPAAESGGMWMDDDVLEARRKAWHGAKGGEKHTPAPTIMFSRAKVGA